jgi:hypothetical protein
MTENNSEISIEDIYNFFPNVNFEIQDKIIIFTKLIKAIYHSHT